MKLELAHDSIAKKIGEKISEEDKRIRKIQTFIRERYLIHKERHTNFLEKEDIDYIRTDLKNLDLNREEEKFLNDSIRRVRNRNILKYTIVLTALSLIAAAGSTALYLQFKSDEYRELLIAKETKLEEKTKEIEIKTLALKDKLQEEEELDIRLSKIHSIIQKTKSDIVESEKIIEEKKSLISDADATLKKDHATRLESFRIEMAKPGYWTDLLGEGDWESAKKKCASLKARLPNKLEWESVILTNQELIGKWKSEKCCKYWTVHSDSSEKATLIDLTNSNSEIVFKDNVLPFLCVR